MISRVRDIFIVLTNSIRKKLVFYFMFIIVVLVSASAYTFFSGKALNELYNNALEKHLLFNDVFVNLANTNELLEKYLKSGSQQTFDQYGKAYPLLLQSANNLEITINGKKYTRETIDLKYMIQSYIEEANNSISLMKERNLKQSNVHYYNAQKVYKLINGNFKSVYSIILEDTSSMKNQIIDNRKKLYTFNGILIAVVGVTCIIFMQWFSASLTKPIKKLTQAASRVSKGDMTMTEMQITTHDEVSILSMAFNKMIKKIDQQITEIKEKADLEKKLKDEEMENLKIRSLLKESELKALQSRINPHFLFNSLNMISQTAYLEEASQTTSLLESMSDLLRYNLDKFSKVVTIEDEVGNIRDYIFIQQKRFGERIKFEVSADDRAYKSMIPCLIIQPLVENSIIHGVGFYTQNGIVGVSVKRVNERVILSIYDNGVGIDKDKLECLERIISSDNSDDMSNGIGLNNVCARLRIFYNNDVRISLKSEPGKRTEVILDLPYKDWGDTESCIV